MISDDELDRLQALSDAADPPPWTSIVERRDQWGGSSVITVGDPDAEDIYLSRDHPRPGQDNAAIQDLVVAARNYLPILIDEIRRLRAAPQG